MADLVVFEVESGDKSQFKLKCDLCRLDGETVDGIIVCLDCMECLCNTCSEIHLNNEVFKGHNTVTNDTLPVNFTSQKLHELKDMIFCDIHEVQFEYYCEDHAKFVCQPCTKKTHRSCNRITKIQNIQVSPQSVLSEIQETRQWFQKVTQQRKELRELESAETKRQIQLKTTILAKIHAFTDQGSSGNKKYDNEDDTEAVDLLCEDVKRVVQLQDRHEDLLRAVLHLNDTDMTLVVSRRVALSLEISSLKQSIESIFCRMGNINKIADRLEILEAVIEQLRNASHCEDNGNFFNRIRHLIKETTYINAEVQTDLYQDSHELFKLCVSELSTKSSDVNTTPQAAVRETCSYKDAAVQTEDAIYTSSTIPLGPCTTEYLTASADVDTEPDDVTGPCTIHQSDDSGVAHVSRVPDSVDDKCQTPDCTKQRDTNIRLLRSRLEYIGEFNVCSEGETHCDIEGIVVLKDKRVALIDKNNKNLKIYDGYLNFQISYRLKWLPVDICVLNYDLNHVAISFDYRRVETYEVSGNTICYIRGFDLSLCCRGISSVSANTIAVLVSDGPWDDYGLYAYICSDEDYIKIQIRDINNGRIISSIDTFKKQVRNPVSIIEDNRNNIIIGEESQVSAFDKDGDRLWYYNGYKGRKLENVQGMDMDPEGNIYICSLGSNSIHQVSSYNYRHSREIIPYVPAPKSVAYDPHQERLIVGCFGSKCVNVYKFG